MEKIVALTDYKGNFGSKHMDTPYRSGMDKSKLVYYFLEHNYEVIFSEFSEINWKSKDLSESTIIYTSSEDPNYFYKNYIEDIIYALELSKARVIPSYKYLKANNNKVFMELLRNIILPNQFCNLKTFKLGTIDELEPCLKEIEYPVVLKGAMGASGTTVRLAKNEKDLIKKTKKIARTFYLKNYLWELGRTYKHKGYIKDSIYRKKFIIQQFVPNLKKDWKILVFGKRYFVLTRYNRENDFRASGSKTNYKPGTQSELTHQILDFAEEIFQHLDIPHVSLDIAFDGEKYYLIEMQGIYFGTSIVNMSDAYFVKTENGWSAKEIAIDLEKIYADSICQYIKKSM
ncbi:ATP-grasp domain-containing protein [Aquimarina aquimarini]|uniref:ATP-grasp domain-containing protein n=1 Tax=Aquimarina aquimarini TaxID=1191734 RepID=UPI000D55CEEE|nr:hypothetical protein [Aquimarina aquimarini]